MLPLGASFVSQTELATISYPTLVDNENLTSSGTVSSSGWEAVAQCESSGNWSINTGNGFSGGLQFTPSTWDAYGGTQYAPMAYEATEAQQIAVANDVLAGQGIGAWPVCGAKY